MLLKKILWTLRALLLRFLFHKIGFFTYIGKPMGTIGLRKVKIGNKVRIFPGLRLEVYDQGKIIINDNVSIGQNFHITSCNSSIMIGKDTTISGNVFITNIDHDYKEIDKHILEQEFLISETKIGDNCFIGFGVAIQAGTILGKQCIVGANSVVRGSFPDYSVIVGAPARIIKRYNFETKTWEKQN